MSRYLMLLGILGIVIGATAADADLAGVAAEPADVRRAAIHPVGDRATMQAWLARVPATRDFPPDFAATLRGEAPAFVVEMTTAPGCVSCADLWAKLQTLQRAYGLHLALLSREEAMLRSGRFGLPWVGHPVAWARAATDPNRMVPIAVGTDHPVNLARNLYLAFKMMMGVRPAVGVRAMARFTGIVGAIPQQSEPARR